MKALSGIRSGRWPRWWTPSDPKKPFVSSAATSKNSWVSRLDDELTGRPRLGHRDPRRAGLGTDALGDGRAPAVGDDRSRRRCADPLDERPRPIRNRGQLAAAGRRPVARGTSGGGRAGRRRTPASVPAFPERGLIEATGPA